MKSYPVASISLQQVKSLVGISLGEFEELFRSNYQQLCAYANKYLSDVEASEEVVQSTFVKLWENRSQLVIATSVGSYLYASVRNNCLNQLKHFKIRDEYKAHNMRELDLQYQLADQEVEAGELEDRIRMSIEALPEARRKIFVLSRFEGLKYKEIAEKLNISIKTVENQMGNAIKQLKNDLADYVVVFILILFNMMK